MRKELVVLSRLEGAGKYSARCVLLWRSGVQCGKATEVAAVS